MHADTVTKLPLARWFRLIGVHPSHAAGIFFGNSPTVCQQPWMQHPFQAVDRVGREEVAVAIAQAEADIERVLGYRLLPSWEVDEWRPTERPYRPELFNLSGTDVRGFAQTVEANWGYFISGGIRSTPELRVSDAPITYTDGDLDGYFETATVTAPVAAGTDPCEIHVYYPESNVFVPSGGLVEWEIRPIEVSITGAIATITFRRDLAVIPEVWNDYFPPADDSHLRGVDGAVAANFLRVCDVYRVYNDPQTQASFLWEPFGSSCGCSSGCVLCAYSTQTGCLMVRGDPRQSIIPYRPGSWDADTLSFTSEAWSECRQPDIVRLYYYAGWRDKRLSCNTVRMDPDLERIVAYYAAALLDRPICECNNVTAWVDHWQRDMAIPGEEGLRASEADLDNPFGTRRGAVFAWKRVKQMAIGGAVHV